MSVTKKTILVVEDEKPLLEVIARRLEKSGFSVIAVRAVDQAWAIEEKWSAIDAIWLDHYLPHRKTGLDFVAFMYKHDKKIPIFVVTNSESVEQRKQYKKSGLVKGYFIKADYRLDEIIKEIKKHLASGNSSS